MELRRVLLLLMLVCLGIAGLGVIAGVIVASDDALWRFVYSALLCAVAVAFMIYFSSVLESKTKRLGGLAGFVWTLGGLLLALLLIWNSYRGLSDQLGFTYGLWLLCIFPVVLCAYRINMPQLRVAAFTGIALAIVVFAILMFNVWAVPTAAAIFQREVNGIAIALAGCGFIAFLNLVNVGSKDRHYFRWVGIAAAAVALVFAIVLIANSSPAPHPILGHCITAAASVGGILGFANLLVLAPLKGAQVVVRILTLAAAIVCAFALNFMFPSQVDLPEVDRLAAAAGIFAACGILAHAVFARINRMGPPPTPGALPSDIAITLTCPRCSSKQCLKTDGDECTACHLRIHIHVEEPRCAGCGYLLYNLTSPRCPECGTPIVSPEPVGAVQATM